MDEGTIVAILLGLLQGVLEWLPVSSEGSVALALSATGTASPAVATRFALFLHAGTAIAAAAFYRGELLSLLRTVPDWRPGDPFTAERADLTFYGIATIVSAVLGLALYAALSSIVSELTGGAFVALIGALLVVTGLIQRTANDAKTDTGRNGSSAGGGATDPSADGGQVVEDTPAGITPGPGRQQRPDAIDAVLVGLMQGLAILPGVSRSGTTVSALLLRGHDGEDSFRLSFVLSIPASLGAGLLVVLDEGLPAVSPTAAAIALAISAVVGYLTVGALVALVRRVAFWGVCVGFGALAVLGGIVLIL